MARTHAMLHVPLVGVHGDSGRINAAKVAEFVGVTLPQLAAALGASYAAVHKTPDAASLQSGLVPIKHVLALLDRATRNRKEARAWLNSAHPDLDDRTPLEIILAGDADAVVTLLENAIGGQPG